MAVDRTIREKFYGTPLGTWLVEKPNELDVDAVSLESIIGVLRIGFGLNGQDIDEAAHECLTNIMARGARPMQGHSADGGYWTRVTRFGDDPAAIVEGVIKEWHEAGVDPDFGDLWFGSPQYIADECREL